MASVRQTTQPAGSTAATEESSQAVVEIGTGSSASRRRVEHLRSRWHTARTSAGVLPALADLGPGQVAEGDEAGDRTILLRPCPEVGLEVLSVGAALEPALAGVPIGRSLPEMHPAWRHTLGSVVVDALARREPAEGVGNHVLDGMVVGYDMLALPVADANGAPLCLVLMSEHAERISLLEAALRATREGFLTLAPMGGQPPDFQIVAVNQGAARLLGRAVESLTWRPLGEVLPASMRPALLDQLATVMRTRRHEHIEIEIPREDGGELCLSFGADPMGRLLAVTITDVTEMKRREASFRTLFESSPVPMWSFDADTLRFLSVNDAAIAHYGYSREQFAELTILDIRPEEHRHEILQAVQARDKSYRNGRLTRHRKADGTIIEVIGYTRPIHYDGHNAVLVAVLDVTEQRRAEAQIAHMAHHDALTGLPNRARFRDLLDAALRSAKEAGHGLAVLSLDLDRFKEINDTLGHVVGDTLLKAVAERARATLPSGDVIARLGGDEFALIDVRLEDPGEASKLAAALIEALSAPYTLDGQQVVIGASIGIALAPEDGEGPEQLMKSADLALSRVKAEGRSGYRFFEIGMDARLHARRTLELELRKALQLRQFELFYQPLVDLRTDRVSGFEALLRWRHPDRGLVSPAEFMPIVEESGLIVPLGAWALRQACSEATRWPEDIKVAVNLSPVQFKSRDLVLTVASALSAFDFPAQRLELEITESLLLTESETNLAMLQQLRDLGVRIAMDDFGTGYSSLNYLRAFPFDKIKIDRSFIEGLAENSDCAAIVRAVTELAASLGMTTTAEGVETEEQLRLLRARGCTEVQGYLFSPPRPAGEIPGLLARLSPASVLVA